MNNALHPQAPADVQHGEPVLAAQGAVGQALGSPDPAEPPDEDDDPDELLDEVSVVSHEPPMHIAFMIEQSQHCEPPVPQVTLSDPRHTLLRSQQPEQEAAEQPLAPSPSPVALSLPAPPPLLGGRRGRCAEDRRGRRRDGLALRRRGDG
jgi:hypothetical protein